MRAIGEVIDRHTGEIVGRVRQLRPQRTETRCLSRGGIIAVCLTAAELAASGYRELTNDAGERIGQFGLCRDGAGQWVYPPLRRAGESTEQMLARNAEGRRRLGLCPKRTAVAAVPGFDD